MRRILAPFTGLAKKLAHRLCQCMDQSIIQSPCFKGKVVFGPLSTSRFGNVLGINSLPCKVCSYDCLYCHGGRTHHGSICPDGCLGAHELFCVVRRKLELLAERQVSVESILFMPQGEPTLDDNLAQKIKLLRPFGLRIGVLTNASMLWNEKLQEDLLFADHVSIKLDTVHASTWKALNRPHSRLELDRVLNGLSRFARRYRGKLVTETMLVRGLNDTIPELEGIARFLENLPREASCFTIPTRPPTATGVCPPDDFVLQELSGWIRKHVPNSEFLFTPEEDSFQGAGEPQDELMAVLSAQPMTERSVRKFVADRTGNEALLDRMIAEGILDRSAYGGNDFLRLLPQQS